jgi:uncharacterized protein (TIGR03435 family)
MLITFWKRFGLVSFLFGIPLVAPGPASSQPPTFDIVSIRVVPPNANTIIRDSNFTPILPGGQYRDRTTLASMIAFAYNVQMPSTQLTGLPGWAQAQAFDVAAKPADGFPVLTPATNLEQVRLMMRAMLADRFHLQMHTKALQKKIIYLEIGKSGIKVKRVDPPVPPATEGNVSAAMSDKGGRIVGTKSTMAGLAKVLSLFFKQPVVDGTGVRGYYDFDIKWSAPEGVGEQTSASGFGAEGGALLVSMLQNQFGLRLRNAVDSMECWIVDHVELPTEN